MNSPVLNKSALRKFYLEERKSFSEGDIENYSKSIFDNFLKFFDLSEVKKVHCFLPIKKFKEINTQFFIDYFWENNIEVYVPKIIDGEIISVKCEKSTELLGNSWGILEPKSNRNYSTNDFDVVITPLIYCDDAGNRIGYGKGFYDRFFKNLPKSTLKVGINYFAPIQQISDVSEVDESLNYLVIPREVLSFLDGISKLTK